MGWTQNPPGFGPWGFDSPSRHQSKTLVLRGFQRGSAFRCERRVLVVHFDCAQFCAHPKPLCAYWPCPLYRLRKPLSAHLSMRHSKRAFNGVGLWVDVAHGDHDATVPRNPGTF
jgi:hypothetical protein